ncbi:MAG: MCP four helix bundle domain-containing protein, partial [Desulfuromonadaceae bacterium]|nr:MCP four helix bundle domain-containing protein [Desulfuromonadaceae bacterium]
MNIMKNMKIGTKILGLVGILIIMMGALAGYGILKMKSVGDEIKSLDEQEIPLSAMINEAAGMQKEQEVLFQKTVRLGITNQHEELKKTAEEFDKVAKEADVLLTKCDAIVEKSLKETAGDAAAQKELKEVSEHLKEVENEYKGFDKEADEVFTLLEEGKLGAAAALEEKVEKEGATLDAALSVFVKLIDKNVDETTKKIEEDEALAIKMMAIFTVVALFLGFGIGIFVTRGITRPINEALGVANSLSQGDLTISVESNSRDETGQ